MIQETALVRAMKSAYKGGCYEVVAAGGDNTMMIHGGRWCVIAKQENLPRKALALLVEHIGDIPNGQAYRLGKDTGAQMMVMDTALEQYDKIQKLLACKMASVVRTPMRWKGYELWQASTLTVDAFDGALTAIADPRDPKAVKTFDGWLVCKDELAAVIVEAEPGAIDGDLRDTLSKMLLAPQEVE